MITKHLKSHLETFITNKITIDDAEAKQEEFNAVVCALTDSIPQKPKYIEAKNKLLNNVKKICNWRQKTIKGIKNEIFPIYRDEELEEEMRYEEEETFKKEEKERRVRYEEEERSIRNQNGLIDYENLDRLIDLRERDINSELVEKHFQVNLKDILEELKRSRTNPEKNKIQVSMIKSGLIDLKKEYMNKQEKEIDDPDVKINIVKKILEFNRQRQQGQGHKMLTTNQMLSGLPISLAQLKAENNSEKLKNEIGQLLYSLYRS